MKLSQTFDRMVAKIGGSVGFDLLDPNIVVSKTAIATIVVLLVSVILSIRTLAHFVSDTTPALLSIGESILITQVSDTTNAEQCSTNE